MTFAEQGHTGKGFVFTSPKGKLDGFGWYGAGQPEWHERLDTYSFPVVLEFVMNNARLRGEIWGDELIFKDVAPLVVAIDYKALLGESYRGRESIVERIDCGGR